MISALKHILVFRNITTTSKQFLTFFLIFTKVKLCSTWNPYWLIENKMFTIIGNGSLKWFPEMVPGNGSRKWFLEMVPGNGSLQWFPEMVP